jgi:hypothetical protein
VFGGRYPVAGVVGRPWPEVLRREIGTLSDRFDRRRVGVPVMTGRVPATVDLPPASA